MSNPSSINHAAWGVEHNLAAPFDSCVVTDYSENSESQHQYEYDQQGAVAGAVVYDTRVTLTASIQAPKSIELPKVGELLAIDAKQWLLTACDVVQNNQAFRKVSITAERYNEPFSASNIIDKTTTKA